MKQLKQYILEGLFDNDSVDKLSGEMLIDYLQKCLGIDNNIEYDHKNKTITSDLSKANIYIHPDNNLKTYIPNFNIRCNTLTIGLKNDLIITNSFLPDITNQKKIYIKSSIKGPLNIEGDNITLSGSFKFNTNIGLVENLNITFKYECRFLNCCPDFKNVKFNINKSKTTPTIKFDSTISSNALYKKIEKCVFISGQNSYLSTNQLVTPHKLSDIRKYSTEDVNNGDFRQSFKDYLSLKDDLGWNIKLPDEYCEVVFETISICIVYENYGNNTLKFSHIHL
jgi:hypothetical protein